MTNKEKLLISSCLYGELVRYDGKHSLLQENNLQKLQQYFTLYPMCPEVLGGLPIPRKPCEIQNGDGFAVLNNHAKICQKDGTDKTSEFLRGSKNVLDFVQKENIKYALLKSKSPSCGNHQIYDGSFTNQLISGLGVTAALLQQNDVIVFNEHQLVELLDLFRK